MVPYFIGISTEFVKFIKDIMGYILERANCDTSFLDSLDVFFEGAKDVLPESFFDEKEGVVTGSFMDKETREELKQAMSLVSPSIDCRFTTLIKEVLQQFIIIRKAAGRNPFYFELSNINHFLSVKYDRTLTTDTFNSVKVMRNPFMLIDNDNKLVIDYTDISESTFVAVEPKATIEYAGRDKLAIEAYSPLVYNRRLGMFLNLSFNNRNITDRVIDLVGQDSSYDYINKSLSFLYSWYYFVFTGLGFSRYVTQNNRNNKYDTPLTSNQSYPSLAPAWNCLTFLNIIDLKSGERNILGYYVPNGSGIKVSSDLLAEVKDSLSICLGGKEFDVNKPFVTHFLEIMDKDNFPRRKIRATLKINGKYHNPFFTYYTYNHCYTIASPDGKLDVFREIEYPFYGFADIGSIFFDGQYFYLFLLRAKNEDTGDGTTYVSQPLIYRMDYQKWLNKEYVLEKINISSDLYFMNVLFGVPFITVNELPEMFQDDSLIVSKPIIYIDDKYIYLGDISFWTGGRIFGSYIMSEAKRFIINQIDKLLLKTEPVTIGNYQDLDFYMQDFVDFIEGIEYEQETFTPTDMTGKVIGLDSSSLTYEGIIASAFKEWNEYVWNMYKLAIGYSSSFTDEEKQHIQSLLGSYDLIPAEGYSPAIVFNFNIDVTDTSNFEAIRQIKTSDANSWLMQTSAYSDAIAKLKEVIEQLGGDNNYELKMNYVCYDDPTSSLGGKVVGEIVMEIKNPIESVEPNRQVIILRKRKVNI